MTEQIGPSMSTEPGWMSAEGEGRRYLWRDPDAGTNKSSMLLSFERPA